MVGPIGLNPKFSLNSLSHMASFVPSQAATNSDSVDEVVISDYFALRHVMGVPLSKNKYPNVDFRD